MEPSLRITVLSESRLLAVLISALLGLSATLASADTFRWKDKEGKVHYGAVVPAEYADQPYDVLNNAGLVIRHVEDTSVSQEVIVEKETKPRQPLISDEQRQVQSDRLLVIQYSSVDEIKQALELEVAQLSYDVKLINQSFQSTDAAIREQVKRAANQQRAGIEINPDQKKEIDSLYARREQDIKRQLAMKDREAQIRARFQTEIERYQFLTSKAKQEDEKQVDNS